MPYQFQFFINNHLHFSGDLERKRCIAHNKNGTQCKRQVCIGLPYCFQHSLSVKHLKIKQSTIPGAGKGLFAIDPTKRQTATIFSPTKNDGKIIEYTGQLMNLRDIHERYDEYDEEGNRIAEHTAPYALELNKRKGVDSALSRGIGSIANHKPIDECNAIFQVKKENHRQKLFLIAIKAIKNGDEIFVDYQDEYDLDDPEESNRTVYKRN
jgi:SET domain-containing protein